MLLKTCQAITIQVAKIDWDKRKYTERMYGLYMYVIYVLICRFVCVWWKSWWDCNFLVDTLSTRRRGTSSSHCHYQWVRPQTCKLRKWRQRVLRITFLDIHPCMYIQNNIYYVYVHIQTYFDPSNDSASRVVVIFSYTRMYLIAVGFATRVMLCCARSHRVSRTRNNSNSRHSSK